MTYDTSKYYRNGDVDDLSYEVANPEVFTCGFTPTSQGLHV